MKIKCALLKVNSFRVDMSAKCVLMVLAVMAMVVFFFKVDLAQGAAVAAVTYQVFICLTKC